MSELTAQLFGVLFKFLFIAIAVSALSAMALTLVIDVIRLLEILS